MYKIKNNRKYYVADPSRGTMIYALEEFEQYWVNTREYDKNVGIALFMAPNSGLDTIYEEISPKWCNEQRFV